MVCVFSNFARHNLKFSFFMKHVRLTTNPLLSLRFGVDSHSFDIHVIPFKNKKKGVKMTPFVFSYF